MPVAHAVGEVRVGATALNSATRGEGGFPVLRRARTLYAEGHGKGSDCRRGMRLAEKEDDEPESENRSRTGRHGFLAGM